MSDVSGTAIFEEDHMYLWADTITGLYRDIACQTEQMNGAKVSEEVRAAYKKVLLDKWWKMGQLFTEFQWKFQHTISDEELKLRGEKRDEATVRFIQNSGQSVEATLRGDDTIQHA